MRASLGDGLEQVLVWRARRWRLVLGCRISSTVENLPNADDGGGALPRIAGTGCRNVSADRTSTFGKNSTVEDPPRLATGQGAAARSWRDHHMYDQRANRLVRAPRGEVYAALLDADAVKSWR